MSASSHIEVSLRGVTLTQDEADRVSRIAQARVPADARKEKPGPREALEAVYAAIVRTAEQLPVFDYEFGDELCGLAALLHELKQP